jgi:sec-independent protein translocase protein TatA
LGSLNFSEGSFGSAFEDRPGGGAMGEGLFQPLHLLLIVAIALLVFGTSKFAAVGKGLGEGIRNFKTSMKDPEVEKKDPEVEKEAAKKKEEEEKKV